MSVTDPTGNEYLVGAAARITETAEANQDLSSSLKVWAIAKIEDSAAVFKISKFGVRAKLFQVAENLDGEVRLVETPFE